MEVQAAAGSASGILKALIVLVCCDVWAMNSVNARVLTQSAGLDLSEGA
jgi:hypothetical protein